MELLTTNQRNEVSDATYNAIGYPDNIRRIFFSDVNRQFKALLPRDGTELVQLELDLVELNRTGRLTDGTVPFESWLNAAARYLRPYPDASQVIQQALATVASQLTSAQPIVAPLPPSATTINAVITEKAISQDDMLSYAFLRGGMQAGVAVARMRVARYEGGQLLKSAGGNSVNYLGTGWLLTNDLIITNHHVINARDQNEPPATSADFKLQAQNTRVQFDFDAENTEGTWVEVAGLEAANLPLDYTILRLAAPVQRPPLPLLSDQIQVVPDKPKTVNIIQHPNGKAKKVALRNNHIFDAPYPKVRYFTDTETGSSGSPVFDDDWRVIALHRASSLVGGVSYQGQKTAWVNEGVQIKAILDHLQSTNAPLLTEIIP